MAHHERETRSPGARRCDVARRGFIAAAAKHAAHATHAHSDVGTDPVDLPGRSLLVGAYSMARDAVDTMECPRRTGIAILGHRLDVLDDSDRTRPRRSRFPLGDGKDRVG